jgi:hypothetical protein
MLVLLNGATHSVIPHFAHLSNINTFFYNLHLEVQVSSFVFL